MQPLSSSVSLSGFLLLLAVLSSLILPLSAPEFQRLPLSLCRCAPGLWGSSSRVGGGETEALCWRVRRRRQAVLTPCPCMAVLSGNTQTEKRRE